MLERPSGDPQAILDLSRPMAMEIRVIADISRRSWSSLWTQSVAINSPADFFSENAESFARLLAAFQGPLAAGDVVRFVYTPDRETKVIFNDVELIGGLPREVFALLLRSWLGPVPTSTAFRDGPLGKGPGSDFYGRYRTMGPSEARRTPARQWGRGTGESIESESTEPRDESGDAGIAASQGEETRSAALTDPAPDMPASEPPPGSSLADEGTAVSIPAIKSQPSAPPTAIESDGEMPPAGLAGAGTNETPVEEIPVETGDGETEAALNTPPRMQLADGSQRPKNEDPDFAAESLIAQQKYINDVRSAVYRQVRYPLSAMRRNLEGQLRVSVKLTSSGEVLEIRVVEPAGFEGFNQEILRAIETAAPYNDFPEGMAFETFIIDTPFVFRMAR